MIAEMQTILLKPKSPPLVERRFEQALPARTKLSPLGAFWHTEVGTLNQIILLWPYASLAERQQIQAEADRLQGWPPDYLEFSVAEESMILKAVPFSPPIEPRKLGNIYDIRSYTYRAGSIPTVIERWSKMMDERIKLSPLVGCWYSDIGPLHRWVQIWAYADAAERQRIRADAVARRLWPPDTMEFMLKQENMLAVPAAFSPLR
jgi:NIPSNAP